MLRITGATFTCGGCSATLAPGPRAAGYGIRCRCGWVLLPRPLFGRWVTL